MILVVIQFVVITNGAGRVAEVGARFTLDAMPGKQMAIDADLNAGLIDEDEARRRRAEVAAEADFYGAMDGASKFVKGDAIAAIIITIVNLIGGFAIGMLQHGMSLGEAINDLHPADRRRRPGLADPGAARLGRHRPHRHPRRPATTTWAPTCVAQFAGQQQRAADRRRAACIGLCLDPRHCPSCPFLIVGGGLLFIATPADRRRARAQAAGRARWPQAARRTRARRRRGPHRRACGSTRSSLELAADLVDLVDPAAAATCSTGCRPCAASSPSSSASCIPPVRTRDNLELPRRTYAIRVHGVEVGRGEAPAGHVLAIGDGLGSLPGPATTREPVFGCRASGSPPSSAPGRAGRRHRRRPRRR